MRYHGPKNKLARREGIDLGLKTTGSKSHSNLLRRINIIPGQHGMARARKTTDYGLQLRQKQKLKRTYGLTEQQMKNYFKKAASTLGNTAELLIQQLEHRLDNVVYRLGFAPTRASARQLVNHGHLKVNTKKVDIASFRVRIGDTVTLNEKSSQIPYIQQLLEKKDQIIASWLAREGTSGKVVEKFNLEDFGDDINLQLVVEFYSR